MKFYDLFAGIGGFRLGLERAGHKCIGSCEIDTQARIIYQKHFGEAPELDARKLDAGTMPDFDILAAGFPCQPFSLAGKRKGLADTRGTLFYEIARIARTKRPAILFLENVEGLLYNDEGRTFGTILLALDELGYDAEWQLLDGSEFLPQGRKRVFIVGHSREGRTKQVFPVGENDPAFEERQEAAKAPMARTFTAGGHSGGLHSGMDVIAVSAGYVSDSRNGRLIKEVGEPAFSITTRPQDICCFDGANYRRWTHLEVERLMGFPDGWTVGVSDTARYRLLGNAVMPPVIQYIARNF